MYCLAGAQEASLRRQDRYFLGNLFLVKVGKKDLHNSFSFFTFSNEVLYGSTNKSGTISKVEQCDCVKIFATSIVFPSRHRKPLLKKI